MNALVEANLSSVLVSMFRSWALQARVNQPLLNLLGLLDRPTEGTYLFEGIDTSTLDEGQRAWLRSRRIGFVFQSFHILPHRSVLENVLLSTIYSQMR